MPDDRNMEDPGIRVVTTRAVGRELAEAAGTHVRHSFRYSAPTIGPLSVDRLGRFFVMATLILGGADALMLATIARVENSTTTDPVIFFPGWEILDA